MTFRLTGLRLLTLLCAVLLAAGCRTTPERAPTASPSPEAPPAAGDSAWTADTTRWSPPEEVRSATLQAVRTGRHNAYDRAVFAFAGDTLPGYRVSYIEPPVQQCGSGRAVPVTGARFLEVRFTRAQAHTDAGEPTVTNRNRTPGLPVLKGLTLTCDFEGRVTWVLGLPAGDSTRYRVRRLASPARLAVDVRR